MDPLRDEGEAYARKLSTDGVQVQLNRYMGVTHLFAFFGAALPEAKEYTKECITALDKLRHSIEEIENWRGVSSLEQII
jgi:acetyl esterase/lipase